jgi:4-amino-4-deoxy-L-arabinose transferase-like glycosyltransferase
VNTSRLTPITRAEWLALAAVLALAAYLRLANLEATPGWYTDEGTHLAIARHLAEGRVQYLAITQSTLLFAKLPIFELILAGAVRLFGLEMGTLRAVTGSLGVISVGVLYFGARAMTQNRTLGLLAALMLAIFPRAVLYSRFGFSYNLLSPLVLIMVWGLWHHLEAGSKQTLIAAALAVGIGAASDLWMLTLTPVLVGVILIRRWQDGVLAGGLVSLPLAFYALVMLLNAPAAFWCDLSFTFGRVGGIPLAQQISSLANNFYQLATTEIWYPIGLFGLILIQPARLRWLLLAVFLFPLVMLGRTVALYSLSAYYLIPLLPLIALGAASLLFSVGRLTYQTLARWLPERTALAAIGVPVALLIGSQMLSGFRSVNSTFITEIDVFLVSSTDAHQAAEWLNGHLLPGDVLIASPTIAWMVDGHSADMQMAAAAEGLATPHLPADLPADRFAFDPRYSRARYIVVDTLWRRWATVHVPLAAEQLEPDAGWRLVAQFGAVEIYEHVP